MGQIRLNNLLVLRESGRNEEGVIQQLAKTEADSQATCQETQG